MRRRKLNPITGLFFNTGDRQEPTIDDSFDLTRQYSDTVSEGLMEDERLERKHEQQEARGRSAQQPEMEPVPKTKQMPGSHQTCL